METTIEQLVKKIEDSFKAEILVLTTRRISKSGEFFWPLFCILSVISSAFIFYYGNSFYYLIGLVLSLVIAFFLDYLSPKIHKFDKENFRADAIDLVRVESLKRGFFHLKNHRGICLAFTEMEKRMIILADSRYDNVSKDQWVNLRKKVEKNWGEMNSNILNALIGVEQILKAHHLMDSPEYVSELSNQAQQITSEN